MQQSVKNVEEAKAVLKEFVGEMTRKEFLADEKT